MAFWDGPFQVFGDLAQNIGNGDWGKAFTDLTADSFGTPIPGGSEFLKHMFAGKSLDESFNQAFNYPTQDFFRDPEFLKHLPGNVVNGISGPAFGISDVTS